MVGYNITIQLINHVDALTVWDLRPHAPPLTMSVVLTGNKIKRRHDILKSHDHVLFYALLFASSCRSKRNYPAAETECYSDNNYTIYFEVPREFF
jgi:hypothetical protein